MFTIESTQLPMHSLPWIPKPSSPTLYHSFTSHQACQVVREAEHTSSWSKANSVHMVSSYSYLLLTALWLVSAAKPSLQWTLTILSLCLKKQLKPLLGTAGTQWFSVPSISLASTEGDTNLLRVKCIAFQAPSQKGINFYLHSGHRMPMILSLNGSL